MINGNPIHGEVVEKQKAREIYENEKRQGRDAGLTEQDSYKAFDISISQVQPQQETKVRLVYLQPVHLDTGIGRFVYPLEEDSADMVLLTLLIDIGVLGSYKRPKKKVN